MESAWQIRIEDENRQLSIAKIAKQASELVHCAVEARDEVTEIEQVLAKKFYDSPIPLLPRCPLIVEYF